MKVKCIRDKGSKYLIKDQEYEVTSFTPESTYSNGHVRKSSVRLSGVVSNQDGSRFETSSGMNLSKYTQKIESTTGWSYGELMTKDNIKVGDYVKCITNRLSSFVKGNYYKISNFTIDSNIPNWGPNKGIRTFFLDKVQFEGSNRKYGRSNFRVLSTSDKRKLSIGELLGDDINELKSYDRKWDSLNDTEKKLLLFEKIVEANKLLSEMKIGNVSIKDFILKRRNDYGLIEDDFKLVENLKIKDLL